MGPKLLTIFNIVAGACSILGFIYTQWGDSRKYPKIAKAVFLVCLVCIAYVLFFPQNILQKNVSKKIPFYSTSTDYSAENVVLRQSGSFTFSGTGTKTITFNYPYKQRPEFTVSKESPKANNVYVESIHPDYAVITKSSSGGYQSDDYVWFARGEPLFPLEGDIKVTAPNK